ncbi:MAG: Gfo/Idh/MocA family oxidoreductase [Clostridia bacterium]|nr:Gfo/Idh/MocA family oxidoreductase [Clostridia bacterium]
MLSYAIIGSGYRAEYFGRIAAAYPDLFRAVYLCRSGEKAALMQAHTGMPAVLSPDDFPFHPDFAVIAVDRSHVADVAEEWISRGFPVVTETPVGDTTDKLIRMWNHAKNGARIVCCEQYHRYPILAAGIREIQAGRIGIPSSLYISFLHDYHAASILRRALSIRPGEPYTMHGIRQHHTVTETDSRYGAILDGRTMQADRDMVYISYASGKEAIYDFCPVQYRSFIRSRHMTVRGTRGEWSDTQLLYLDAQNLPVRQVLTAELPEKYRCLDSQALRDKRRNWSAELAPDTVQDEFAIASILLDMNSYLSGGPSPYPIEDALEDAYFWILLQEAVASPFAAIQTTHMPWHDAERI